MRNTALLAAIGGCFLLATPALAQDNYRNYPDKPASMMGGAYIGAYGGYSWNDVDTDLGTDLDVDGGEYGVMVGAEIDGLLDKTVNQMGLGLTGALEIYYTESNADDSSVGVDIEKDHDWGITFRPGLAFLDNNSPMGLKPYGILGWRRANFDASAAGLSDDEDFDGFELGLGTEVFARDSIGMRLDYSHVFYEEKNGIDPDEDSLRLGVLYHF
jgi:opacity protein-like surface antigen